MLPWKRKEVLVTSSPELFGKALDVLRGAGIEYSYRTERNAPRTGVVNYLGSFGENLSLETLYYVYVLNEDAEKAHFLINRSAYN